MYIRLNRTHWAFWSRGKGVALTKPPALSLTLVFPSSFNFFSLFPWSHFNSLALFGKSTASFVPTKCSQRWGGRYPLGRTDPLAHSRQLAPITHCCSSSNSLCCSWTQQQPNGFKTNSAESSAAKAGLTEHRHTGWQELEGIFFPFSLSTYPLPGAETSAKIPWPPD